MAHDHDDGSGMAAEAELFFIQIGLADPRERERLLALGNQGLLAPCAEVLPPVDVRPSDSSVIAPSR